MLKNTVDNKPDWLCQTNEEILHSLSLMEQDLAKSCELIKIKDKRGRHLPVLLTPSTKLGIQLLCKTRKSAGILDKNEYDNVKYPHIHY